MLDDFDYPVEVERPLRERGLRMGLAEAAQAARILAFEQEHFPRWAGFFADIVAQGQHDTIACIASQEEIVATVLIARAGAAFAGRQWRYLSARPAGAVATLGVMPARRGQGLGLALIAYAMKCVKDSGARSCFFNYSEAQGLYRKLGVQDWAEYEVCELAL
jgi:GNAT superfamily N-acetyltransferase